jgi:lysophospholipase L1-like esterase
VLECLALLTREQKVRSASQDIEARYGGTSPAFVLVGDSLAAGWPPPLLCNIRGLSNVTNLAVGGSRLKEITERLSGTTIDYSHVELCIVSAGTNDLTDGRQAGEIISDLAALVVILKLSAPSARILILEIPPRVGLGRYSIADHAAVNRAILSGQFGIPVETAWLRNCATYYQSDGLHLSVAGYRKLTETLRRSL